MKNLRPANRYPVTGVQHAYNQLVERCVRERDPLVRRRIRERLSDLRDAMVHDAANGHTPAEPGRRRQEKSARVAGREPGYKRLTAPFDLDELMA